MLSNLLKIVVSSLLCSLLMIFASSAQIALADYSDCKCVYESDPVNGSEYYVLRKDADEICTIIVLSKTNYSSPRLTKLKDAQGYSVVGKFKTFAGANFMAMGECPNCGKQNQKN